MPAPVPSLTELPGILANLISDGTNRIEKKRVFQHRAILRGEIE